MPIRIRAFTLAVDKLTADDRTVATFRCLARGMILHGCRLTLHREDGRFGLVGPNGVEFHQDLRFAVLMAALASYQRAIAHPAELHPLAPPPGAGQFIGLSRDQHQAEDAANG